jgi:hypothetical protein
MTTSGGESSAALPRKEREMTHIGRNAWIAVGALAIVAVIALIALAASSGGGGGGVY